MHSDYKKLTLVSLTWPIFVEIFLRMLLGNVNVFMMSQYSDQAVGAVGVANQLINMLLMIYGIVAVGTAVIISQSLGAGKRERASQVANVALILNFFFGLILSIIIAVFARVILKIMNLPDDLMEYAVPYLVIVGSASFTQALIATMSAIARNYGQTKIPMYIAIGMNFINAACNYLVVFRPFGLPAFGVEGIAFSVVISEIVAVTVMFYVLFRHKNSELYFRIPRPFPFDIFKDIVKIGIPGAGGSLSYNTSQIAATYIVTMLGADALTTRTYMQSIIQFIVMLGMSIGQANQILVGHMVGAAQEEEAHRECLKNLGRAITFNFGITIIFFIFRRGIIGIYTDNINIINMAQGILFVSLFLEPGRALNLVLGGALQGAGDVRFPVIIGIISSWGISVVLSYILGVHFQLGLTGVFIAFAADEWTRGLILLMRWQSGIWKKMRIVKPVEEQEAKMTITT